MSNPARLHVVGVVGNDIVFDTRIKKVAAAAAAAGYRSTILCYTADGTRRESRMGDVTVIRVPVDFSAYSKNGRVPRPMHPFDAAEAADRHAGPRTYQLMKKRRAEAASSQTHTTRNRLSLLATRITLRARRDTFRARRKLHVMYDLAKRKILLLRRRLGLRILKSFRDGVPNIADYEVTFGPILEELEPDLIHAHDFHMIGLAVTAARNLRASGKSTKVLYDAHELIEGLSYDKRTIKGWLELEGRFIRHVDAITGVSPEQLDMIRHRYRLTEAATVVMNAPISSFRSGETTDIKSDLEIDGKLLVYHGNVGIKRGLDTVIEALALMPGDVHLALVTPSENPLVVAALARANELEVAERLHVRGYVASEELVSYLSTADVGVVPYQLTGNHDIALPNKLFESIQAGLPLLVSDMRSLSRYVTERGIGEVFTQGSPADLAEKAHKILSNKGDYVARMTPDILREASWDSQADKLVSVYKKMVGGDPPEQLQIGVAQITEDSAAFAPEKQRALVVGPRNMAGQAYAIASAVQRELALPSFSISVDESAYSFPAHRKVTSSEWHDPAWQRGILAELSRTVTHVLAESGTGIAGASNGGFIDQQAEILEDHGITAAVLLHGSEIRDPKRHRHLPFSPYATDDPLIQDIERASSRLRRHLSRIDAPVFVTTPDLLEDIESTWLPVVVDIEHLQTLSRPRLDHVPTVLHLPSNGLLKGTAYIDPVLETLAAMNQINYLRPSKGMKASGVQTFVERADIVVDQLVIGAYGVMACQALAAGKIVIANTRDLGSVRDECPIIAADPESFADVMKDLIRRRNDWPALAESGREYVVKYHSGTYTASALTPFLGL